MKKNFQLFIFFLFTLTSGLLVYMGNEIMVRLGEVEEQNKEFKKELENLQGVVKVVKSFNSEKIEIKEEAPAFPDKNLKKVDQIKPIEGFYCEVSNVETVVLELLPNNKLKFWDYPNDGKSKFRREMKPNTTGEYFIKGTYIYLTVRSDGMVQNRKASILKVDGNGYATQIEGAGRFLTDEACPRDVRLAY